MDEDKVDPGSQTPVEATSNPLESKKEDGIANTGEAEGDGSATKADRGLPSEEDEKPAGTSGSTFASLAAASAPFASVGTSKAFSFGTVANGEDSKANGPAPGRIISGLEPNYPSCYSI